MDRRGWWGSEDVTSASAGVALSVAVGHHRITTNGDQDLDIVTLADGSVDGELHEIVVVAVGHIMDTLKVTPASPGSGTDVTFSSTVVGTSVVLRWDGTNAKYQIVGGSGVPVWA